MRYFDFFDGFFDDGAFDPFLRKLHAPRLFLSPKHCVPKEGYFHTAPIDVWEEKGKVKAKIDLPGVDKKDIDIKVHYNLVEVKAEKKHENKRENKDFFSQERCFAGFYKSFALPYKMDSEKIEAQYKDGVLEITAPKTEEETKKIEVK